MNNTNGKEEKLLKMKGNNEAIRIARYSPGKYKAEAVLFLKQYLDRETFERLSRSESFRRNPVVCAKIYLSPEDWNKYVWIEQHGSLDGFVCETVPDTGQKKQSTKIIDFSTKIIDFIEEETKMKQELEKYIGELSPEMQEKACQCKSIQELNALLAENDVELSEDALEAVAGGCSKSSVHFNTGDLVKGAICPGCGSTLYYWDMCNSEKGYANIIRMYCSNPSCSSFNNGLWYCATDEPGQFYPGYEIKKY